MKRLPVTLLLLSFPANADDAPSEVRVRGPASETETLRQSADAVTVIGTAHARRESADLGEVVARTEGVSVRRDGGLGSATRFSLNGLEDDQIRFFLDGVPLERAGFPFGIANVPVGSIDRIDVYRGVVPIRLGADALGGALNLVTRPGFAPRLAASYQVGSFGTMRGAIDGTFRHEPTGLVVGASAFVDHARNDYPVDVEVTDAGGRTLRARVRRFHDRYEASGARLAVGVVERPWARKLLLEAFASTYDKQLQNNVVMTVPYGEVHYGETTYGATVRYEEPLAKDLSLEAVASYSHRAVDFVDGSPWIYDWFGRKVREKRVGGETTTAPSDRTTWENGLFGRALVTWQLSSHHTLRISATPSSTTRTGDERLQTDARAPDPFGAARRLVTVVTGVEHRVAAFGDRLEGAVFAKDYAYHATGQQGGTGGTLETRTSDEHALGAGAELRWRFAPSLLAKVSYEYTTRLPRADEVFGNGILVGPNLGLAPERSHNVNVGPHVDLRSTPAGRFTLDANAFLRGSDRLIVLLGTQSSYRYENIHAARTVGVEEALAWRSPGGWLGAEGTLTWQDIRNVSSSGTFAAYDGDRIPNRPSLFASWGARMRLPDVGFAGSALEPFYHARWVADFYRAWESQGLRAYKQVVTAQLGHDVGVSYTLDRAFARTTTTLEIDNATNARLFDFFGVQRPGRALFLKTSVEL